MDWLAIVVSIVAAAFGSTGLWQLIQRNLNKKNVHTLMLLKQMQNCIFTPNMTIHTYTPMIPLHPSAPNRRYPIS